MNDPGDHPQSFEDRVDDWERESFSWQSSASLASFDAYVWRFVNGKPLVNRWKMRADLPAESLESQALSEDLKRRGFRFVGPTIMYAFMQATGLVDDHLPGCLRRARASKR